MAHSVRKNAVYTLRTVLLDHNLRGFDGEKVRVIELPGCKRSHMPRCFAHIEHATSHAVLGMVHTNSLVRE